jgi:eukaryotic-like serine/threonine-protein kinase
MDRERWREIDAAFQEALGVGADARAELLGERFPDDPELREAVGRLLEAEREAESFLEESAGSLAPEEIVAAVDARIEDALRDRLGERVGAFRIVRQVGRGGMAGVYEGVRADGEFEQRVAIKFLRPGLDREDFVRRFMAERQILSSLQHPNIARLIDGGRTEEGLPYLALEYVEGVPITEHCEAAGCTLEERLRLFVQVARAVQHAHSNLVVHRDIKPSNILVTPAGEVKLLDFGIAKLLDPDALPTDAPLTRTGFRPLTPEYASPEQIRGEPIKTASDVYQLGVLLYRLLTGERPYPVTSTGSTLEQAITTAEPLRPSDAVRRLPELPAEGSHAVSAGRLSRRLRGDLDTIVLKALRKEPERRYATALEMADDVERHLDGRPIAARRDSALYRTAKFLRRHRWVAPVSAAAAVAAAGYVATLVQHGQQLEEERNVARDVQQAFVGFFTAPDSADLGLGEGRRDLTILQAILDGTERVRRDLADRPAARAELFGAMATVLQDLDETDAALELATEALELETELYGSDSPQVHETLLLVGELTEDPDSARELLERRLELSLGLYGPDDVATATSLHAIAGVDQRQGRFEDAMGRLRHAIEIFGSAEAVPPRRLALSLRLLAENLEVLDRADEAVVFAREGYEVLVRELGERHSQTATVGARLAQTLTGAGHYDEARPLYETSLAVLDAELGPTHATTMSFRNDYAILLRLMGDAPTAEAIYRALLEARRERHGDVHGEVAAALQNLAVTVKDQGRYEEAEQLSRAAFETFEQARGTGFFQTAFPLLTIAEIALIQGDYAEAETVARHALTLLSTALPPGHFTTSVAECRVGQALAGRGRRAEARPFLAAGAEALVAGDRREVDAYRDECLAALQGLEEESVRRP